jgi:chromosome segregation ATPase
MVMRSAPLNTPNKDASELETKYTESVLQIQSMQEHKVATAFELGQLKDRAEDMQEDLAEAKAEIRKLKAELRVAALDAPTPAPVPAAVVVAMAADAEAEMPTIPVALVPETPRRRAAADNLAEEMVLLTEELDSVKSDNMVLMEGASSLQTQLEAVQAELNTSRAELAAANKEVANAAPAEQAAEGSDDVGSERIRARLVTIRSEKRELENQVDDLTSQVRKLDRESKRNEGGLRAELDALREAYDKLRARRNRQAGVSTDTTEA